jgi:hypothetical protein
MIDLTPTGVFLTKFIKMGQTVSVGRRKVKIKKQLYEGECTEHSLHIIFSKFRLSGF